MTADRPTSWPSPDPGRPVGYPPAAGSATATLPPPVAGAQGGWPPPPPTWPPTPSYPAGGGPTRPRRTGLIITAAALGLVLMLVVATLAFAAGRALAPAGQASSYRQGPAAGGSGGQAAPANPYPGGSGTSSAQVAAITAKVSPAVVDITTTLGYQNGHAAGTGIVLSADGLVLTNNHVVSGASSISTYDVGNGRTYPATVVGYDRTGDVAVIKLSGASGLTTASIGDSGKVNVGDAVVALGNAGGTGGAPTPAGGSVTGLDRSIVAQDESTGSGERLTGLIEVGANIQAGDSGGPLVNSSAQVIGMDTAASASFQTQSGGDGYAIPINTALTIAKQIEAGHGSNTVHIGQTAFLGVQIGGAGSAQAASGAAVVGVEPGSPAASAGLAGGDTVQSIGSDTVDSATTLSGLMDRYHPGDRVSVGWTDATGQSHTATVTLVVGPVG